MLPAAGNVAEQASDHPTLPALARFAERLPYMTQATNDFREGAYRMARDVALTCREVRPDPPEWITALRLDVDCPCPGGPHRKAGRCEAAATAWIDAELPAPNLIPVNPANGHAHYTYQLASWVRLDRIKAVRYFTAIRKAFTAALGADPGYAGAFVHNPLHPDFSTKSPRAEPFTLAELATYVDLHAPSAPKLRPETETAPGRNCTVFDRVRKWGYKRRRHETEF